MPRHIPQERKFCISEYKKIAKRKDYSAPSRINALDRIMVLDGLVPISKLELSRPRERPDKWADKPTPKPAQTPEDVEAIEDRVRLAKFHLEHYGGANGANTSTTASAPGAAVQSPDPAGKPE